MIYINGFFWPKVLTNNLESDILEFDDRVVFRLLATLGPLVFKSVQNNILKLKLLENHI